MGEPSARDRTADGKMHGNALVRRAERPPISFRFLFFPSGHKSSPGIDGMMASCREGFVTSGMPPPGCPAEELDGEDHAGERGGASFRAKNLTFPQRWSLSSFEKAFGRPAQGGGALFGSTSGTRSINPPFLALTPVGTLLKVAPAKNGMVSVTFLDWLREAERRTQR